MAAAVVYPCFVCPKVTGGGEIVFSSCRELVTHMVNQHYDSTLDRISKRSVKDHSSSVLFWGFNGFRLIDLLVELVDKYGLTLTEVAIGKTYSWIFLGFEKDGSNGKGVMDSILGIRSVVSGGRSFDFRSSRYEDLNKDTVRKIIFSPTVSGVPPQREIIYLSRRFHPRTQTVSYEKAASYSRAFERNGKPSSATVATVRSVASPPKIGTPSGSSVDKSYVLNAAKSASNPGSSTIMVQTVKSGDKYSYDGNASSEPINPDGIVESRPTGTVHPPPNEAIPPNDPSSSSKQCSGDNSDGKAEDGSDFTVMLTDQDTRETTQTLPEQPLDILRHLNIRPNGEWAVTDLTLIVFRPELLGP